MRRTARRLAALIGAAVLLVLALAAGPAAALTGAMMIQPGRGTGFVTISSPPSGGYRILAGVLAAGAIALVAAAALAVERRSRLSAAAEGPAEDAGRVCDDVVCEWRPARSQVEERKAA